MVSLISTIAHEVYVLTPEQIEKAWQEKLSLWQVFSNPGNMNRFIAGTLLISAVLALAIFLKSKKPLKKVDSFIDKATVFAPDFIRVAFGFSLVMAGLERSLYGPELPLGTFPGGEALLKPLLVVSGLVLIAGWFSRWVAAAMAALWLVAVGSQGWYMLNYINYFGEAAAVILFPRQNFSIDGWLASKRTTNAKEPAGLKEYSLPIARIFFGFSIVFAAIQVKVMHSTVSHQVVEQYRLTNHFPFDPLFIILAAALIESLIGVLYILGLLIRLNTVIFLIFLTLSIIFFKETVWPHYLLIGLGIGIFLHKPDILSLDRYVFSKKQKNTGST